MRVSREFAVPPISLFPFLSVLVCLMGVLMFLAAAVSMAAPKSFEENVEYAVQFVKGQRDRTPLSLECTADNALNLLTGEEYLAADELAAAVRDIRAYDASGRGYADFLRLAAANTDQTYVMFFIRPDGIETYGQLRRILAMRNDVADSNTVYIDEVPDLARIRTDLPEEAVSRIDIDENKLTFRGQMTREVFEVLKGAFEDPASRKGVDELYRKSKDRKIVDYGTELILPDESILVPEF